MIFTPLEQFQKVSLIPLNFLFFDLSLTNSLLISLFTLLCFYFLVKFSFQNNSFFLPHIWQFFLEIIHKTILILLDGNINKKRIFFLHLLH